MPSRPARRRSPRAAGTYGGLYYGEGSGSTGSAGSAGSGPGQGTTSACGPWTQDPGPTKQRPSYTRSYASRTASGLKCRATRSSVAGNTRAGDRSDSSSASASSATCPFGTTCTSSPNNLVELDAARMIGGDDGRAGRERLDGDGRQRFEQRRQREHVGDGRVARDVVVRHEAGERDAIGDAQRRACASSVVAQRTGAADDEPHVVPRARQPRERVDQEALSGQLVQPLDVQNHERLGDAERGRATRRASRLVARRERVADRRIDDRRGPADRDRASVRVLEQPLAVERHRARAPVGARERIDRTSAGGSARSPCRTASARTASPRRDAHAAATSMMSPLLCRCSRSAPAAPSIERRADQPRLPPACRSGAAARQAAGGLASRQPQATGPARQFRASARPCAGSCATNETSSPRARAQRAELGRQQRVGRLIGRQMRRDVTDAHGPARASGRRSAWRPVRRRTARGIPRTSRLGAQLAASRTSARVRADRRTRRSSPCVAVVRAAADDRFARVKEQIEDRHAAPRRSAARARSCLRPSCRTAAATGRARCAAAAARASSCTATAPAPYQRSSDGRHAAIERGRDRQLEQRRSCPAASRRRRPGSTA